MGIVGIIKGVAKAVSGVAEGDMVKAAKGVGQAAFGAVTTVVSTVKGDTDKFIDACFEYSIFGSPANFAKFIRKPSLYKISNDWLVLFKYAVTDGLLKTALDMRDANRDYDNAHKTWVKGMMDLKRANGQALYPDANSTLRLTYGKVASYSPADGVVNEYATTLRGVMEKENPDNWEFVVPDRLKQLYREQDYGCYARPDGEMPVCFIVDTDNNFVRSLNTPMLVRILNARTLHATNGKCLSPTQKPALYIFSSTLTLQGCWMTFDENRVNSVYLLYHNTSSAQPPTKQEQSQSQGMYPVQSNYMYQQNYADRSLGSSSRSLPVSMSTSQVMSMSSYPNVKQQTAMYPHQHAIGHSPGVAMPMDGKRPATHSMDLGKRQHTVMQGGATAGATMQSAYAGKQPAMQNAMMSQQRQPNMQGMQGMQ